MEKQRLELFSDGVFVIVLTLLVLDLKPPAHQGLDGVREIAPGLIVHAVTFFVIGMSWLGHHNMLVRVHEVNNRTLQLNLLTLFWITLIPFAARIVAEDPLGSLGICLFTTCGGLYNLSARSMRLSIKSPHDESSEMKRFTRKRSRLALILALLILLAGALCWVSPWFGYAAVLSSAMSLFVSTETDVQVNSE